VRLLVLLARCLQQCSSSAGMPHCLEEALVRVKDKLLLLLLLLLFAEVLACFWSCCCSTCV
jgi:hypothetical protein